MRLCKLCAQHFSASDGLSVTAAPGESIFAVCRNHTARQRRRVLEGEDEQVQIASLSSRLVALQDANDHGTSIAARDGDVLAAGVPGNVERGTGEVIRT